MMHFDSYDWDINKEADKLNTSLFGNESQSPKKKAKKRQKANKEVHGLEDGEKEPKQKKWAADESISGLDVDLKEENQKNMKDVNNDSLQFLENMKKDKFGSKEGLNVGSLNYVQPSDTVNDRKVKKKKRKHEETPVKYDVKIVNACRSFSPKPKATSIKSTKTVVKEVEFKDISKCNADDAVDERKNSQSKNVTDLQHTKDEKQKKKRKRKCRKNKFKDYNKTDANEKEDTDTSHMIQPSLDNIADKIDKSSNKSDDEIAKKEKVAKHKEKSVDNVHKKLPNKQSTVLEKTELPKLAFDPKALSNMLSGRSKSIKNTAVVEKFDTAKVEKTKKINENQRNEDIKSKPKSLLEKNRERLNAARFRYINEQLYTTTGNEAFEMFQEDREAFGVYHEGFQSQVEKWPVNPVDKIIEFVKTKRKNCVIADFGCGDAKLARSVTNKVHSFDLVALNDHVTVCDMEHVPLEDGSIDIAVFCLSLMGTNLSSYLQEANRVLRKGGVLMIAEVTSRFKSIGAFVLKVEKMGFHIINQDTSNKMFVLMDFRKTSNTKDKLSEKITLDPCLYKKR